MQEGLYIVKTGCDCFEFACKELGPVCVHGHHAAFAAMLAASPDFEPLHEKYLTGIVEADDFTFDGRRDLAFVYGYRAAIFGNAHTLWHRMRFAGQNCVEEGAA